MIGSMIHTPVLKAEVLALASACVKRNGYIFDVTLGGAGHSYHLLEYFNQRHLSLGLLGTDRDETILKKARKRLAKFPKALVKKADFKSFARVARRFKLPPPDFILADLGVSSFQLANASRGFSFHSRNPADMRMDISQENLDAQLIIKTWNQAKLTKFLSELVQERFAFQIAKAIARNRKKIQSAQDLARVISQAVPPFYRRGKIHPATKTFLALRMIVNDEINQLKSLLAIAPDLLGQGGRLAIISFHSSEDRLVKQRFRRLAETGKFALINKKPLRPSDSEISRNPRARSAKLRAIGKLFKKPTQVDESN